MSELNNKNIIYESLAMRDETKEKIRLNAVSLSERKKHRFKFPKLAVALCMLLVLTLGAGAYYVANLFFIPGIGITEDSNIIYYGLEEPVNIETEYGLLTVKFVNKITKDGKINLSLFINSKDIPAKNEADYPVFMDISKDGNIIVSQKRLTGGGMWDNNDTMNSSDYIYLHEDFPDINEFDLTLCGVETHIVLTEQKNNFALSEENNGITLAVGKFEKTPDLLTYDVFDKNLNTDEYDIFSDIYFNAKYICYDGEEISWNYGFGGFDPSAPFNYQMISFYKNEKEIKSVNAKMLNMQYIRKIPLAVEIPVPKYGESIKTNIEIPIGSHTYRITEIKRVGDIIYYKNNACEIIDEKAGYDTQGTGSLSSVGIPYGEGYEQAAANNEAYIEFVSFSHEGDWDTNKSKMAGGEIWDFDPDAESLTFYFNSARIIQFGDFDVEFE